MKILSILFILLLSQKSNAQCDKTIVGHWQVIAAFNGEIYVNLKTDSTSIAPYLKDMYPDTSAQNKMLAVAKELYGATNLIFQEDGNYKLYFDTTFQYGGKYCYTPTINMLEWTSKNALGTEVREQPISKIEKGLLFITQKWDEDDRILEWVLEKKP